MIRSSQDFGQIRICRPANLDLPGGKLGFDEFAARQIGVFGTILLNWNLPFSLLGEQMLRRVIAQLSCLFSSGLRTQDSGLYFVWAGLRLNGYGEEEEEEKEAKE